jgi:long-chain acyl-CoA synthetase
MTQPIFPKSLSYPAVPLHALLEKTAQILLEKPALICGTQELSYTQLNRLSNRFANALLRLDVQRGDRVALYLPNTPQFVVACFGALKAGCVVTAVSPLHKERVLQAQLCDSGAKVLVAFDGQQPIIDSLKEKPLHVITADFADSTFSGLLSGLSEAEPGAEVSPATLAALQYTGGTTGTPKAAMLTHKNLVSNATQFAAAINATQDDVFLAALPLFHIYGFTTSLTVPLSVGAKIVLLPKFEPTAVLCAIERHRVTVFCGVPTMYQLLTAQPDLGNYDLASIRVCVSGASALPPQTQKQFMAVTDGVLVEGYGLSEASPVTHCNPPDRATLHVGSIGFPLPDTEVRIVDLETSTRPLPAGEVGELAVKGPQVMSGYWNRPEETALVLRDGWLLTGDIARMGPDGCFYLVDRKKDLIKHKGYSIYPRELEDVLYEHPVVKLCAVVGKPVGMGDEVPVAFVVPKMGTAVSEEELKAFVNCKVASYMAIREVTFQKELPISAAGKVLKRALRKP